MSDLDQSPAQPFDLIARGPTEGLVKDYSDPNVTLPGGVNLNVQFNNFGTFGGLTDTQLTARIGVFTALLSGAVAASGGGATNFLRADGVWAAPPGGAGIPDGDKGDITVSGSGTVWVIDPDTVTYAKMQHVSSTSRFLGRISSGSGIVEEVTGTQATALLDVFTNLLKGLVPPSGGGNTTFLRADGGWAVPSSVRVQRSVTTAPVTILSTDEILNLNLASATNISLPASGTRAGARLTFKDVGPHAQANNITLIANGTEKIDGSTTFVMNADYMAVTLTPFNDGVNNGWFII